MIIAHRLSTIRNAHKIIVLKNGHIAEIGTHIELMNLKGVYHELVTAQLFETATSEYASATDDSEAKKIDSKSESRSLARGAKERMSQANWSKMSKWAKLFSVYIQNTRFGRGGN